MGFGLIIAGFILLLNPIVHVIDILPDCIGFFLICKGLSKMCYMNSSLSEARDIFRKLGFVELARVACIVFIPYTSSTAMLLFAFVFGVVELIYFLPALSYFYDGLNYIGMEYDGPSVFAKKEKRIKVKNQKNQKGKKQYTTKTIELGTALKWNTYVFYVLRIVCTLLPELTALQMYENLGTVTAFSINFSRYKPFLYVVLGLVVLGFGIRLGIHLVRYFSSIAKDEKFIRNLNVKYDRDIAVKTNLFVGKNMKTALLLYIFAIGLSVCFYADGVNIFPGVISSIFLVASALIIGKYVRLAYAVIPFSVMRSVLSVVNLILQKIYFIDEIYDEEAVKWVEEAYEQYYRLAGFCAIENIFAMAAFVVFALAFLKAVKLHLAQSGIQDQNVMYSKKSRDIEIYNAIGAKLLLNIILMIINFVLAAAYPFIMLRTTVIVAINAVITIIWLLQSLSTVSEVNDLLYTPLINEEI